MFLEPTLNVRESHAAPNADGEPQLKEFFLNARSPWLPQVAQATCGFDKWR